LYIFLSYNMPLSNRQRSIISRILTVVVPAVGRFALTVFILTLIAIVSLLVYNSPPSQNDYGAVTIDYSNPFRPQDYYQTFDPNFNFSVLIDVHSHTDVGGGQISPETTIQWHIANGFNAFVVTDHNGDLDRAHATQQLAREKYNDKIKVLIGEEWSNCRMHMGLLGLKEFVPTTKTPTDVEIQQVINATHAQGGVVVVNHIPWSTYADLSMPSKEDLVKWGVDYFDVTTGQVFDLQTLLYARSQGVGVVAATDIHEIIPVNEWTLLNPDNFTEESILDALRSHKTSFIFDFLGHNTPTDQDVFPERKEYIVAIPWLLVGRLFHTFYARKVVGAGTYSFVDGYCGEVGNTPEWVFDTTAIGSSVAWLITVWLIFEIVFGLIRFAFGKITRRFRKNKRNYHNDDLDDTPLLDLWNK